MPFNGSGTFTIVNTFVPNTTILSAAVNQNFTDIATGLSDCLTRDNQAGMTAIFRAVSGSVSAPGITFNSDTTAGLFLSSTGIVGLVAKSLGLIVNSAIYCMSTVAVQAGGSGYAVGDTITLTGGTAISQAVLTVATLSGSAVATATVTYPGFYTVKPSDPVAQGSTSGVGSGATFNITWVAQFSSSVVTNEAGALPWQRLGSSSYMSGLMASPNGLALATGIGASALTTVIGGTFLLPPQGVLSPISSTTAPFPTSDQTAVTRIYWTPYNGNVCPIYNGTSFAVTTSSQIFCDLVAGSQVSGGIYDVYKFLNSGTVTLGFSPSWLAGTSGNVTAGSCARGTGAGGAALAVLNGVLVNAASMTLNNSSTTYSVAANQATYLGSIYVNSTAGQINCHVTYGQSRVWGLWNAWNQRNLYLMAGDATASWNYATNTTRPANNSTANSLTVFCGLAGPICDLKYTQFVGASIANGATMSATIGIGYNATNAYTQRIGTLTSANSTGATYSMATTIFGNAKVVPSVGINTVTALENGNGSTATPSFNGTATNMMLSAEWAG